MGRMASSRQLRAEHAVEDVLSGRPGGASTMEVLDRLIRVGLMEREALDLLAEMREQALIELRAGRWRLPLRSGDRSITGLTDEGSRHLHG